jgi:SHS2 domain-containing protein
MVKKDSKPYNAIYSKMMESRSGFREREHTADWELEVWAPDLAALLEQAARGMYTLSGTCLIERPRQLRIVHLTSHDPESMLVHFLNELLYLEEQEGEAYDRFDLQLNGLDLRATLEGAKIQSQDKEIKAVTYHNLTIRESENGLRVQIVFDV